MKKMNKRLWCVICTFVLLVTSVITLDFAQVLAQVRANTQFAIVTSQGSMETACVTWTDDGAAPADGYNVYYAEAGTDTYKKIDDELIRRYPGYWRADVLGLAGNKSYTIKVVPIVSGAENESKALVSAAISVVPHVREGYAFDQSSTYKTAAGAYNEDGTLKAGAQVVYVTAKTAKTVQLDVVTSNNGATTHCTGIGKILEARQKGYDKKPLAIRFIGEVNAADMDGQLNTNGYLQVKGKDNYTEMNITVEGVGNDAVAKRWGILVSKCGNTEVRNMGVMLFPDDGISLDTGNCNVWVHNNDVFYGVPGADADQVKGDGSIDVKKSKYITVSYNHFWDSGKAMLLDADVYTDVNVQSNYITYHHNWFDHSDSRHPRIRHATVHVYNNYYDGVNKYGVGATSGSSVFVEANVFRCPGYPMLSSMQGSEAGSNTLSGEAGGMIKAYNNQFDAAVKSLIYANSIAGTKQDSASFDAYLASSRDERVPDTYKTKVGGTTYNNFDTAPGFYRYNPTPVRDVASHVKTYAGRMYGGDFKWTFAAGDDASHEIDPALKTKLENYKTSLVSVGGTRPSEPENPSGTRLAGDVNGDGEVGTGDVVLLMQYLAEMQNLSEVPNLSNADVNGDGEVGTGDVVLLMQYLAEMDVTLK